MTCVCSDESSSNRSTLYWRNSTLCILTLAGLPSVASRVDATSERKSPGLEDTGTLTPGVPASTGVLPSGILPSEDEALTKRLRGRSSRSNTRFEGAGFLEGALTLGASFLVRWAEKWVERLTSTVFGGGPWLDLGCGEFSLGWDVGCFPVCSVGRGWLLLSLGCLLCNGFLFASSDLRRVNSELSKINY